MYGIYISMYINVVKDVIDMRQILERVYGFGFQTNSLMCIKYDPIPER